VLLLAISQGSALLSNPDATSSHHHFSRKHAAAKPQSNKENMSKPDTTMLITFPDE
jgi:hypothetical protein